MKIIVLGAAAGGGFPQWNANSALNRQAFAGDPNHLSLTQCSLAISTNGDDWVLLNASPDIRQQVIDTPELHPREGLRSSPIKAVILTGADVDAFGGLLILRERQAFDVWATRYVLDAMARNPIFNVLASNVVSRREIQHGKAFTPVPGITAHAYDLGGKPPLYLEASDGLASRPGANLALHLRDTNSNGTLAFIPSCAEISAGVEKAATAEALFFDGTMYTDDEMISSGEGKKTARRMGHMPMHGPEGSIEHFSGRRTGMGNYFIHINNSNPILNRASPERMTIENAGWQIAEDGMEIEL
jgi:pyrroloquinoline quinone biosynthesis protein B